MNKNTIIGFILMSGLFVGMMVWNEKSAAEREAVRQEQLAKRHAEQEQERKRAAEWQAAQDTLSEAQKDSLRLVAARQDSLNVITHFGPLANASQGEEKIITLENEVLRLTINTHGGMIESATLKQYINNLDSTELRLFDTRNNNMAISFEGCGHYRDDISTSELYFEPVQQTDSTVTLRLATDEGGALEFVYGIGQEDSYLVDFTIRTENLDRLTHSNRFNLKWNQKLSRTEIGRDFEERYSSLYYRFAGESPDDDELESSSKNGVKNVSGALTWFNFKNQFFSSMLVSRNLFRDGELKSSAIDENDRDGYLYLKDYAANVYFDMERDEERFCFFFGPNNYPLLNDLSEVVADRVGLGTEDIEMEHTIYLGWPVVRWVNRFIVLPFFHWLDSYALNYGLIILLMTLLIKLITLPFTYKSFVASAKMRIAQQLPEIQKINEKYPNQEDAMQKQQELMAFYGKIGVSQMGGCVPMLLQWPVLIALFYFFPTSIELRGESFLWAHDLSTYDAVITWDRYIPVVDWIFHQHISLFCILMTATNIFYTWLMQKQNPSQQSMPGMKAMMYVMPLMFLAILNNYSAGLSYYYFLSTLIGIILTYGIRATLNETKILEQMKYNLTHPKKKSEMSGCAGLAARAQEAQKLQQKQMKEQARKQYRK
ncbi:MAG: membrane protein insertase YidC [Bacteroidales bacterium]|nr:membrane protein insertase YidC [Bacteroidales bacterium]